MKYNEFNRYEWSCKDYYLNLSRHSYRPYILVDYANCTYKLEVPNPVLANFLDCLDSVASVIDVQLPYRNLIPLNHQLRNLKNWDLTTFDFKDSLPYQVTFNPEIRDFLNLLTAENIYIPD